VYVESSEKLNEAYYFKNAENGVAVGIYANSSNSANALAFIDYVMTAQE
jgi:ABC-type molybdate transport system substrate-binding protein